MLTIHQDKFMMGGKTDQLGNFVSFPGITVVASASENKKNLPVLQDIYTTLASNPIIAENFSLLPVSSYHMTTMDLYTQHHTRGNWLDFVSNNMHSLQQLDQAMKQRDFSPVVVPRGTFTNGVVLLLVTLDAKQSEAIHDLAREFNFSKNVPEFHITFAYQYRYITPEAQAQLADEVHKIFNAAFKKHYCAELTLSPARLCYFDDMTRFVPWDALENPFVRVV